VAKRAIKKKASAAWTKLRGLIGPPSGAGLIAPSRS
jgi:hypothetical protein